MSSEHDQATPPAVHRRLATGDLEALAGFITDDCIYITTTDADPGRRFQGREAVLEGFAEMLPEPGDGTCFGEVFVDGSRGCVEWWVGGEGTTAPCMRGCDVFRFRADLIARKDAFRKVEAH